jgi:hypothetical protein
MRTSRLLPFITPLAAVAAAGGLWACVVGTDTSGSTGGSGGSGGAGGAGGVGGVGGTGGYSPVPEAGPVISCHLDNMADPVAFCTQKLVLRNEHAAAYDAKRGIAQSWSSATFAPDVDASQMVLHDPRDDAAFGAAVGRYLNSANTYGDDEITLTLEIDIVNLVPTLVAEMTPPVAGYAGDLYLDLRTMASGLRITDRNDLALQIDALAEAYGRAIYTTSFVTLGASDAVLGTPTTGDAGAATTYSPGDAATGAYALADLAQRHASDEPANAAAWQSGAALVFAHLDSRARDPATGLYYASLVTSADPDHDALAPAAATTPDGAPAPPADALLTDVAARVTMALLRTQDLATNQATALPALAAAPLEAHAEALLGALDKTPQSLWDATLGGYFAGWVPSTAQLLTDKPTRANALLLGAIHRASVMGNGPDETRLMPLRKLLAGITDPDSPEVTTPNTSLMSVVTNQNGYFLQVPPNFNFMGVDAGGDIREKSYFSSANAAAVEGLSELWFGVPN